MDNNPDAQQKSQIKLGCLINLNTELSAAW